MSMARRILAGAVGLVFVLPLWMDLVIALGKRGGAFHIPPTFWPSFHFGAMTVVLTQTHWLHYVANSVLITATTIIGVLTTSLLAGYALAQLRPRGSGAIFVLLIAVMMLPQQALIIPQYVLMKDVHLLNSFGGLILPFTASGAGIFLFRQAFMHMPPSYREAARVDGASTLYYLWRVAIPLLRPAVATTILVTFVSSWNMFQWPLIMADSKSVQPIELALSHYMQAFEANWRELTSAALLAMLPVFMVYGFAQRHIIRSVGGGTSGLVE